MFSPTFKDTDQELPFDVSTFSPSQDLNLIEDTAIDSNLRPTITDQTLIPTQGMPFILPPDLQIDNELIPVTKSIVEEVSSPNVPIPSLTNWHQIETVDIVPISARIKNDTSRPSSLRSNLHKPGRISKCFSSVQA